MKRKRYTIVFEHGDRPHQWLAHVKEIPGCHTFCRGLAQTRVRIREALGLWIGAAARNVVLREVLPLPGPIRRRLDGLAHLRRKLEAIARATKEHQAAVVCELAGEWSMRDIGAVLDLSHQRVNQIAGGRRKRVRRKGKGGN